MTSVDTPKRQLSERDLKRGGEGFKNRHAVDFAHALVVAVGERGEKHEWQSLEARVAAQLTLHAARCASLYSFERKHCISSAKRSGPEQAYLEIFKACSFE